MRWSSCALIACLLLVFSSPDGMAAGKRIHGSRPNVLFIIADDLRDYTGWLGGHPQSLTPRMDELARRGMRFTNAHCNYALCNPSRTSLMTGLLPASSGVFGNEQDWRRSVALLGKATLPRWFQQHGWMTAAGGKIFHANHGGPEGRLTGWHGGRRGFEEDAAWDQRFPKAGVQIPRMPVQTGQNLNGMGIWHWDWGAIPVAEDAMDDALVTDWASAFLRSPQKQPFFLAVGLYRPHSPWYVPQSYFDGLPPENEILLPEIREDDLNDLPATARAHAEKSDAWHRLVQDKGLWRSAVRAYLANVRFCDAMLGRVLDGLAEGPHAENTIVVFTSDHGWYLGEKQMWHKGRLWEEATRVPLTIHAPGVTRPDSSTAEPVALIDLYPTLCELAKLPLPDDLDGQSLAALLRDPTSTRDRPAVTCMGGGDSVSYAARDRRYRYIRYADGSEELYDHQDDPKEWQNRASDPALSEVRERLAAAFPNAWTSASRAASEVVMGPDRIGGGIDLVLQMGDDLEASSLPDLRGCGVLIETRFAFNPEVDGDSTLLSHGTSDLGYALHLEDGKVTLTVRANGEMAVVNTHRLLPGWQHVRALIDHRGLLSISVPGVSEMLGEAPFEEGFPASFRGRLSAGVPFGVLSAKTHPNATPFDGQVDRLRLTFTREGAEKED